MILSLLLVYLVPIASSLSNFPIVETSWGSVRGYEYTAKNGVTGEIFKKIPYAAPPIGSRRWKKPEPPEKWNYTLDGTFFGPACAQRTVFWKGPVTGFSEDCLNVNVYTSKECRESIANCQLLWCNSHHFQSNSSCPVLFYIHGGVTLFDGAMKFPDETMITNFVSQGVIIVTVDYRLGVFGVMALGDENVLPNNLAVHDVLAALRFIRKELYHFGGDKDQISIMGHSSGAMLVMVLAFSPGINKPGEPPLFARAIPMSGAINLEKEEVAVQRSHAFAKELGCTGSAREIYDCLLPFSTDEILRASIKSGSLDVFAKTQLNNLNMGGELVPSKNMKEFRENQRPMHLMIGTTLYESKGKILNFDDGSNAITEVSTVLGLENEKECSQKHANDVIFRKFETDYSDTAQAIYLSDWLMASAQAKAGGEAYLYQYDYPAHALHTDDMYYVMGFHEHPMDVNEEWISRVYPVYFTNFIKGLPPAPDWEPVNPKLMNYYSVNKSFTDGVKPMTKIGYNRELTDYYAGMMEFDENLSKIKKKLLNAPVQYKELDSCCTKPPNGPVIFSSVIVLIILLLIILVFYRYWTSFEWSEEKSPLLSDCEKNSV